MLVLSRCHPLQSLQPSGAFPRPPPCAGDVPAPPRVPLAVGAKGPQAPGLPATGIGPVVEHVGGKSKDALQVEADELHAAAWLADRKRIGELLQAGADINRVDSKGTTPLMLSIHLLPRAQEYRGVVQLLLDSDADPRVRSSAGWSPLDEAVSAGDKNLVCMLFQAAQRSLTLRWHARLKSLAWSLGELPDFECCLRWEFESPVVPLLSKIAPSDVVRIRKRGTSMRIDSTLASWKRFRFSKRRELTTLFRGDRLEQSCRADGGGPSACMVNHSKQFAVDMTEGLDSEEVSVVVDDMVAADVMQWDLKVDELEVSEATTWLGNLAGPVDINGWRARRFDVKGTLGVAVKKKGHRNHSETFQQHFGRPLPANACCPELRAEFSALMAEPELIREPTGLSAWSESTECFGGNTGDPFLDMDAMSTTSEVLDGWPNARPNQDEHVCETPQRSLWRESTPSQASVRQRGPAQEALWQGGGSNPSLGDARHGRTAAREPKNDKVGKTSKAVSASVWLATDFPIPLQQFLPILEALSVEHETMRRLQEVLSSENFQKAAKVAQQSSGGDGGAGRPAAHVFPVRASVPVNLAVRAIVHFESFTLVRQGALPSELFEVPEGYKFVPRREAQKTLNRARKRMLLANLAL